MYIKIPCQCPMYDLYILTRIRKLLYSVAMSLPREAVIWKLTYLFVILKLDLTGDYLDIKMNFTSQVLYTASFFFLKNLFIYGCVVSSFLCEGLLQLWQAGAAPHRGALASHYRGLSCCGAQAPDTQAQ